MKPIILLIASIVIINSEETRDTPDLFGGPVEPNYTLRVTAKIITEDGKPLENADVHFGIENFNDFKDGSNDIRGKTNKDGKFSAEGDGRPVTTIVATKNGYYLSRKDYGNWDKFEEARVTGKYIPWDPVIELTLRKVGKPIPMIVRLGNSDDNRKETPALGKEVGFDLFENDWVAPHGKGKTSDLLITLSLATDGEENKKVTSEIRFGNPDDGLVPIMELAYPESELLYPPIAVENGYNLKTIQPGYPIIGQRADATTKEPMGYMFRIRTQKDKATGSTISANYGKIIMPPAHYDENANPFLVYAYTWRDSKRILGPWFMFTYYLNPTPNDRNIEYDRHHNLAPEAENGLTLVP